MFSKNISQIKNIPFLDLKSINSRNKAEINEAILGVLNSGWYILGEAVKHFEETRGSKEFGLVESN